MMSRRSTPILALALCMLIPVPAAAADDMAVVLDDDFDDNSRGWRTYESKTFQTTIRDGAYQMFTPVGRRMVLKATALDVTSDFDLSAKVRLVRGPKNYGYGIAFAARDARSAYYFYISGDGHYQVAYFDERPSQPVVEWKRSKHVRTGYGQDNDLRVERRGGDWIFYVNGRQVERIRAPRSFGNSIGFGLAGADMEVHVTSIRAVRIGPPLPNGDAPQVSTSQRPPAIAALKQGQANPRIVAVFAIEDRASRLKKNEVAQLTEYLEALIAGNNRYAVVPRATIKRTIVDAKKASYEACYDEACQIELGKAVAAETIISTKIVQIGSRCAVTASVFDLQKEITIKAATERGLCSTDALVASIDRIAEQL